jgi:pimeloyl-ACP methyl ester carboxylesterase
MIKIHGFMIAMCLAFCLASVSIASVWADQASGPLPRKAMLGAALGPMTAELRSKSKLPDERGVAITEVLPETSAAAAGLNSGDVVKTADGKPLLSPSELVAIVSRKKAGDRLTLELVRDGKSVTKSVELKEKVRRKGDGFEVLYDSVTSRGHRLRSIITRPKDGGRHPAVLLIQGLGNYSIDNPTGRPDAYDKILDELTRSGFVTMRVDKPGCGDSEGGPWPEIGFMTELDGYRQGLKALKAYAFVDPERVFLFGHSMGGLMAPLLASEEKVKGVAVYGTVFRTWFEYQVENVRRQSRLAGDDFAKVERNARNETLFQSELYLAKKSPAEIVKAHPELRQYMSQFVKDDKYIYGGHFTFFQQLADLNLPEAWAKTDAHVLALWGKGDFVAPGPDHEMIAEAVNSVRPGRGTFRVLDCDHGFSRSTGFKDSFARASTRSEGEFNPVIITTLKEWMERVDRESH